MLNADKLSTDKILAALAEIRNPDTGRDLVSSNMISGLQVISKGEVIFSILVDPQRGAALEPMRQQAERKVAALCGVKKVSAVLTAERAEAVSRTPRTTDPHGMEKNPKLDLAAKNIIVISSGKGGVGKSTVATNIAYALANYSQLKIGILDADIYGPSLPKMFGLEGHKPEFTEEKKIIPPHVQVGEHGLKVMSIGFMVDASKALVWRGPMVQSAIYQLFRDVEWGTTEEPLDILIVDMPPGTGDAQLTLAQKVSVTGAVIVSTPQDIALIDARKGIEMFQATNVPILGIVENMSTHVCSNCGHEDHIFGHGGARTEAEKLGVRFLGEIPLSRDIREKSDAGQPAEGAFKEIAGKIRKMLS
jgi:ATP-binding protein involved in chromosome partitioning